MGRPSARSTAAQTEHAEETRQPQEGLGFRRREGGTPEDSEQKRARCSWLLARTTLAAMWRTAWSVARGEADLRTSQEVVMGLPGTGDRGCHSSGSRGVLTICQLVVMLKMEPDRTCR